MEVQENLDNSEILPENNEQDLQIEEEINNQPDEDEAESSPNDQGVEPEETDEGAENKKPTPEEKRNHAFRKLKGQKKQLRQENEALRQELEKLKSKSESDDPMAQYDPNKYTPEQWRNLEIKEGIKQEMREQDLERKQAFYEKKEAEIFQEEFQLRLKDFKKEAPDYDKVMESARDVIIPDDAVEIIQGSEQAPQMAYFLAKNREQAEQLAMMSPRQREMYLHKLEVKIELQKESKVQVSKAKATPKKGGSGGAKQDLSSMSMEEYAKFRRRNSKRRGNR